MDIILGKINVIPKQLEFSRHLVKGKVLGFGAVGDQIIAVCSEALTDEETSDLVQALAQCPTSDPEKDKIDQDYQKALDKISTAAGLSKDEKDALKQKGRLNERI